MSRHEELQEQYEDALFRLLMDKVATEEGKLALEENERLKNDPNAAVPEDVDKRCMQTIRRHFAKQRVYTAGRFTARAMKRVVMAAGVAALLFTGAFAVSETVRVNTLNLMIEVFDTNTTFRFGNQQGDRVVPQISAGWLPEGYALEDQGSDQISSWSTYQKSENETLYIDYTLTYGATISVDTEDAEIEYVDINGERAMLISKENELQLVWATDDNTGFVGLIAFGMCQDDLIHVANDLIY